jgi:hypothetical protein
MRCTRTCRNIRTSIRAPWSLASFNPGPSLALPPQPARFPTLFKSYKCDLRCKNRRGCFWGISSLGGGMAKVGGTDSDDTFWPCPRILLRFAMVESGCMRFCLAELDSTSSIEIGLRLEAEQGRITFWALSNSWMVPMLCETRVALIFSHIERPCSS